MMISGGGGDGDDDDDDDDGTCRSAQDRAGPGGEGHETLSEASLVPSVCSSFFRAFETPSGWSHGALAGWLAG
jgi:hypothetical protein